MIHGIKLLSIEAERGDSVFKVLALPTPGPEVDIHDPREHACGGGTYGNVIRAGKVDTGRSLGHTAQPN